MPKERDRGGIASDTVSVLHHSGGPLFDRIAQLTPTVVAMDSPTHLSAGVQVVFGGWAHGVARNLHGKGRPLHGRQWLAGHEP